MQVPEEWLAIYERPIGLVETYGLLLAYKTWGRIFKEQRVIFFCDNWSCIDVLLRGYSDERCWRRFLLCMEKLDNLVNPLTWISRVPSSSNIADPPSRGSLKELRPIGRFETLQTFCPLRDEKLCSLFECDG